MMVAGISFRRIGAVVLRHLYLFRSSWLRILDSIYWPAVQMVMWGFLSQFLALQTNYVAQAFGVLLSGLLLWEVLIRGNLSLSIAFLEEMWSRNLGHLFVSPLRPIELAAGIVTVSLLRTLLGMIPVSLLAWAFFGFSIYQIGPALLAFFLILQMFGWSVGLSMAGLIMRMGLSAETFAWAGIFILLPISGVYYPVSALPGWLQMVAWCVPTAYVFEGMRSILTQQVARWDLLAPAFGLSLLYLALGFRIFLWCFHLSRRDGTLLQQGE